MAIRKSKQGTRWVLKYSYWADRGRNNNHCLRFIWRQWARGKTFSIQRHWYKYGNS